MRGGAATGMTVEEKRVRPANPGASGRKRFRNEN